MPAKYDGCVKEVKREIATGRIPKTYMSKGVHKKSNAYAICHKARY